jgi:hypothetical protein
MSEDKGTDAHIKLLRQFEEAFDSTQDARREAERDRDYYDGIQYTDEELETLRQRKQRQEEADAAQGVPAHTQARARRRQRYRCCAVRL